jgi:hypothetical protein
MFEYELQGDIFEEEVFGRTKNSGEALFLVFGHEGVIAGERTV